MDPENEASQSGPARTVEPHRGSLILTLGVLGLVICPVFGPVAWVMAARDLRRMGNGLMDPGGRRQTRAGLWCGIVSTVGLITSIPLLWISLDYLRSFWEEYKRLMG